MRKSGAVAAVAIVAALVVLAVPVQAGEMVAFHGAMVDANAVPAVAAVQSVVNPPGEAPEAWGGTLYSVANAGPCDSALRSGTWNLFNCNTVGGAGAVSLGFPVHIPTGAVASYVRIYFNQTVIGDTISAGLWKTDQFGAGTLIQVMSPTATTAGNTMQQFGPFSEVIDNSPSSGNTYSFLAITSGATRIFKMMAYYKLEVSPAPGAATFPTDVPTTHPFFRFIEAVAASGITAGCGAGTYCPDSPVTRGQMAVFLASALGLSFQY